MVWRRDQQARREMAQKVKSLKAMKGRLECYESVFDMIQ